MASDVKLVGSVAVQLKDLVIKNYEVEFGTSAVVNTTGVLQGVIRNEILGTVNLKFRMKQPVLEALRWYREKKEVISERLEQVKQPIVDPTITSRKIVINIVKGRGLDPRSNTFIYYRFFNTKDTYSITVPGREPAYDSLNTHEVPYTDNLRNYLKMESLDILLFDDSVPFKTAHGDRAGVPNDIIGRAK